MSRQNATAPVRNMSPAEQAHFFARFEQLVLEGAGHSVDLETAAAVWQRVRSQRYKLALFEDVVPALDRIRNSGLLTGLISNVNSSGGHWPTPWDLPAISTLQSRRATPARKNLIPPFSCRALQGRVRPAEAVHVGDQIESDIDGARGRRNRADTHGPVQRAHPRTRPTPG